MQRKHWIIIGISLSLLFYFLAPIIKGNEWCYAKDESNKPKLDQPAEGRGVNLSLFGYTSMLLVGNTHQINNRICMITA